MTAIKDYKLNPPKKKTDLNEISMLSYVKKYATKEEKKEFIEFYNNNKTIKTRNMDAANGAFKKGDQYESQDIGKLRKKFATMFLPDLDLYKKKKTGTTKATTKSDILDDILSDIE